MTSPVALGNGGRAILDAFERFQSVAALFPSDLTRSTSVPLDGGLRFRDRQTFSARTENFT
jgi:hypothetical protein